MRVPTSLIPLSRALPRWRSLALSGALILMALIIAVLITATVLGDGSTPFAGWLRTWGTSACYLLAAAVVAFRTVNVRESRGPWIVFAVGVSLYGIGNVVWELWLGKMAEPPIPSIADA